MVIKPCKDDLISLLAIWPVIILCEILVAVTSGFNLMLISGIMILNVWLAISSVRDFVYLSRIICLDQSGCTFRVRGYSKQYSWDQLKVQICDENTIKFTDSDTMGPGLLIGPKTMLTSKRIAPMTYCRYRYPFSSVYIRFSAHKDDQRKVTGKIVYYGYTEDRDIIMDHLKSIGIQNIR